MSVTRRALLYDAIVAGGALLSAPILKRAGAPPLQCKGDDVVDEAVRSLFGSRSPFEAQASNVLRPWQVRGTRRALRDILGVWNVSPNARSRPDYSEASHCRPNFEMFEAATRNEGFDQFSGVNRSPYDRDAGILIAADDQGRAKGAQQYGDRPEFAVEGIEPDLLTAEAEVLNANQLATRPADMVRATLVTNKYRRNVRTDQGKVPCLALQTAYGTHLVYVPPQYTKQDYNRGYAGFLFPSARNWYWRGLAA
jgi:hypothetical protein